MDIDIEASNFPVLTYDDFVAFLVSHTAGNPCESCGTDKWTISTEDGIRVNLVLHPYTTQARMSLMTAPILCTKCGNVRFYTYETIKAALDKRAAQ
jgi:hypothetical protein